MLLNIGTLYAFMLTIYALIFFFGIFLIDLAYLFFQVNFRIIIVRLQKKKTKKIIIGILIGISFKLLVILG